LWFTREQSNRDRLLAKSKVAALYWRHGIAFEDFKFLYPECAAFLKQKYALSGKEALMFSNQPWWLVAGHLEGNRDDDHFALLELEIEDKSGVSRFCFQPIDSPDSYENEFQLLATYFSETRIIGQPPFVVLDDDKQYVQQCLNYWDARPEIKRVRIYIRPEYEMHYRSSKLTALDHYVQIGGETIWQFYNTLYFSDVACCLDEFEFRYEFKSGKRALFGEKWISKTDADKFIDLNERIHRRIQRTPHSHLIQSGALTLIEQHIAEGTQLTGQS